MRLVKQPLLNAFPSRIINIHPSLLPAFPGIAAWEQAIAAKAKETGVTVHVVDSGMDTGPILLQEAIPVFQNETPEQLYRRIQVVEHRIYPKAIKQYTRNLKL
jgi:phosphoribosylglycinamide formyltransferase-1